MKITKFFLLALFAFTSVLITSCNNDDELPDDGEELITTLTFSLTNLTTQETVTLTFQDTDGDGGNAPVVTVEDLKSNTSYAGSVTFLDESNADDVEDITEEIEEEDLEHQVFYSSSIAGMNFSYTDADPDGNPIGLSTMVSTGDAGSGTITVVLRHEPDKSASGVSDGDISNAGGETDIEVTFSVNVVD